MFKTINEYGEVVLSEEAHKAFEEEKRKVCEEEEKKNKEAQKPPFDNQELYKLMQEVDEKSLTKQDYFEKLDKVIIDYYNSHQAPSGKEEERD